MKKIIILILFLVLVSSVFGISQEQFSSIDFDRFNFSPTSYSLTHVQGDFLVMDYRYLSFSDSFYNVSVLKHVYLPLHSGVINLDDCEAGNYIIKNCSLLVDLFFNKNVSYTLEGVKSDLKDRQQSLRDSQVVIGRGELGMGVSDSSIIINPYSSYLRIINLIFRG